MAVTLSDVGAEFARLGISLEDVAADGVSLSASEPGDPDSPIWLDVRVYHRDDHGKHYLDRSTRAVAQETRRFRVQSLSFTLG